MTQPGAEPTPDSLHEKSHEHIDLGQLMDGSARGPEEQTEDDEEYGEGPALSGETADGYVSGQDEGSID